MRSCRIVGSVVGCDSAIVGILILWILRIRKRIRKRMSLSLCPRSIATIFPFLFQSPRHSLGYAHSLKVARIAAIETFNYHIPLPPLTTQRENLTSLNKTHSNNNTPTTRTTNLHRPSRVICTVKDTIPSAQLQLNDQTLLRIVGFITGWLVVVYILTWLKPAVTRYPSARSADSAAYVAATVLRSDPAPAPRCAPPRLPTR